MATNYAVDYEEDRFKQVEADKETAMTELDTTYSGIIGESDKYYQDQIDASKEWADKQSQLQQEQTDFTIEQIEQQKDQANKDYLKEQSGAYVDWQKQSNEYGTEAEKAASAGLAGTGYSESSQVSMYNQYQNRVATARESYNRAVMNYNNAIKDARLQNNSVLAEIAYNSLKQQLELSLQGFQYKNSLILEQANKKVELDNIYYNRYKDVLSQINHENAMAEEIRQYNQNYELQTKQYEESIRQFDEELKRLKAKDAEENAREIERIELQRTQLEQEQEQWEKEMLHKKNQYNESIRQFDEELKRLKAKDAEENAREIERIELQRTQLEQEQEQWEEEMLHKKNQLKEERRQFNLQYKLAQANSGGSGSSGGNVAIERPNEQSGTVKTDYYTGNLNPDAKQYGTFSNGYQPKGISGHGKVSKTGMTIEVSTATLSGQKRNVTQNIWKTADGLLWYWEGRQNKYLRLKNSKVGGGGGGSTGLHKAIK